MVFFDINTLKLQSNYKFTQLAASHWGVAKGQIDLAIVGGEIPKNLQSTLDITSYAEDELALILPPSHPFASLEYIQKEDLYRLKFIALNTQSTIRKCN